MTHDILQIDILDVKSCRGADCDSDHYMVKIEYRQRISTVGKLSTQRSIKYNVENLKEGNNAKEYRSKIEELLQIVPNNEDQQVGAAWEDINPLNAKLNPICHLLSLLGAHHILHISRIRVKQVTCKAADNILG